MSKLDDALMKLRMLGYAEEVYAAVLELDKLRGALKPFADMARALNNQFEDRALVSRSGATDIRGEHFTAALKALE